MGRVKGTALGSRRSRSIGPNHRRTSGAPARLDVKRNQQRLSQRKKDALAQVEREREKLERRLAREREQPALGPAPGAAYSRPEPEPEPVAPPVAAPRPRHRFEPYEGDPAPGWTVRDALRLLEQGYAIRHVMRKTGCGYVHFEHLRLDDDGRLRDVS